MGSGSSILESNNQVRLKSVREIFHGEFTARKVIAGKGDDCPPEKGSLQPGRKPQLNTSVFRAKALFMKPVLKNRSEKDKSLIKKQDNRDLLKEIYRRMDPTVNAGLTLDGEVEVSIEFAPEASLLHVKIGRVKDLSKKEKSVSPNPFTVVDVFSAMNPRDLTTRTTEVKRSTCNPNYQQMLTFPMSPQDISHKKLRITVWDKVNSTQDAFLGESLHDILDIHAGVTAWYRLCPQTDISIRGTLETTVVFTKPNSLVVTIKKANYVKACDEGDETSNPYAKVYVTTFPTTFQTNIQYRTLYPVWMESFEFDVSLDKFSKGFVVINVLNKNNSGRWDQRLGDVHIPLANYNFNQNGVSKEYILKDLRNATCSRSGRTDEELSREFREAMKAHMMYSYPTFMFKKHERGSRMVVSCKSRKAQKGAKIIIENGNVV